MKINLGYMRFIGNFGGDVVDGATKSATPKAKGEVSLAVNRKNEDTLWVRLTAWNGNIEKLKAYHATAKRENGKFELTQASGYTTAEAYTDKNGKIQIRLDMTVHQIAKYVKNADQAAAEPTSEAVGEPSLETL